MDTGATTKIRNALYTADPSDREVVLESLLAAMRQARDVYNSKGVPLNTEVVVLVPYLFRVFYLLGSMKLHLKRYNVFTYYGTIYFACEALFSTWLDIFALRQNLFKIIYSVWWGKNVAASWLRVKNCAHAWNLHFRIFACASTVPFKPSDAFPLYILSVGFPLRIHDFHKGIPTNSSRSVIDSWFQLPLELRVPYHVLRAH